MRQASYFTESSLVDVIRDWQMLIRSRRKSSGIDRGYADPVIVHEYVPENDALHLTLRQFVADFSFFRGAKKLSILALSKQSPVPLRL